MKTKLLYILVCGLPLFGLQACDDGEQELQPWNAGPLDDFEVTPLPGGATITYTIPDDPDILYIMAEYERKGKTYTEKSSVFRNSLTIEGFNTELPVKALLYKVNRHEQRSAPLEVSFTPLESPVSAAIRSLKIQTSFGGVVVTWENPEKTELGVRLMMEDPEAGGSLETQDVYYSAQPRERHTFRGFKSVETHFAVALEDKWGNSSDTVHLTTKPYFEEMIKKPYADVRTLIPYDNTSNLTAAFTLSKLWDGLGGIARNGWVSATGKSGLSFTIDLKQVAKLSRVVTHPYHNTGIYGQANITGYELWGTAMVDYDRLQDKSYWLDEELVRAGAIHEVDPTTVLPERTFKDDWQFLGRFFFPRDLSKAEQKARITAGMEFELNFEAEAVRYVRLIVREVTLAPIPPSNYCSMGEITFYGDTSVPQTPSATQ